MHKTLKHTLKVKISMALLVGVHTMLKNIAVLSKGSKVAYIKILFIAGASQYYSNNISQGNLTKECENKMTSSEKMPVFASWIYK